MFDSHAHIISADIESFPPARPDDANVAKILASPFPVEVLLNAMDASDVAQALVVQRGQIYGYDNSYVLAAGNLSGGRLKAVCSVSAADPASGKLLEDFKDRGAVGYRLMAPPGSKDFAWLEGADGEPFWATAAALDLPVCIHFFPWNREQGLARLSSLLDRYPVSRVIIDHLTNPQILSAADCGIDDGLRAIARREGVSLKFTSIPLNDLIERGVDVAGVMDTFLDLVGSERLVWGSDITQSAGSYAEMVQRGRDAVAHLPGTAQDLLLHKNVARIYAV